jgi:ATPase subunit of ABC transporter with duplicated ATPase domains
MPPRQAVLGVENGVFSYGARRVFENISFLLDDARTALVGENGAGKSTLLKCLTGEEELNRGQIVRSRGLKLGYVPQELPRGLLGQSVREVLDGVLARRGAIGEAWKVDVLLDEIGVTFETAEQRFGALSGGWQRLIMIAAAARLEEPDILILDEPTNHLDLSNISVLERWLTEEARLPMLIVSHDREFLDRVTTRTIFLRSDGTHAFKTPFVQAREELLRRDAAAATRRKLEDKEIKRLEQVAARYKAWGVLNSDFHKKQKATEKRISRIQDTRAQVYASRQRRLELNDGEIEAKVALRLHDLKITTPDGARTLLTVERLSIGAGERIALLGVNGAGKSMLLGALARAYDPTQVHYDGQAAIRFNPSCRLVYFDQRMQQLPLDASPLEYLVETKGASDAQAVSLLAKAGFEYRRVRDPIAELSYGERSRLVFLRMKLMAPNFYLLDEPTNHLDIEGQEDLEAQLEETEVSCIFVSHDRYFTRSAATRFLEIRRGRLVEVEEPDEFFDAQG